MVGVMGRSTGKGDKVPSKLDPLILNPRRPRLRDKVRRKPDYLRIAQLEAELDLPPSTEPEQW